MRTHIPGYPRIGSDRELKKASEAFWSGKAGREQLLATAAQIRAYNWQLQQQTGVDLIPSNDFSHYDQVLDMTLMVGAVPERYHALLAGGEAPASDLYFAMARGHQRDGVDLTAMEMTKWFDTNYHYIVPEFSKEQTFRVFSTKALNEFNEAKAAGITTKPVLLGPITYLLLGKEKGEDFHRLDLLERLLPVYIDQLKSLQSAGATWVQIDEPFLALDIDDKARTAYTTAFAAIAQACPGLKLLVTTYFNGLDAHAAQFVATLPAAALHIDLVRAPEQLDGVLAALPATSALSLGVVDGRNIWVNDLDRALGLLRKTVAKLGADRVFVSTSCSLLHAPCDLDLEEGGPLAADLKRWLAFAKEKVKEVVLLKELAGAQPSAAATAALEANNKVIAERRTSPLINDKAVQQRTAAVDPAKDARRDNPYPTRREAQRSLGLPQYPTTTIGSFPQTAEVRRWRADFKKGVLSAAQYDQLLKEETERAIRWQEEIGIDVLVHGEFERNDMVEYFGEQLKGFAFTKNGWVQSYGSRCVKPPVIYGDVSRPTPMTVGWSSYAQSLTKLPVKGMLTGPVTILQWSFVRDDQPRSATCRQIALAIRDEVKDLETAGIRVIQIDEPAIREGLPLRKADWRAYLQWAVEAFRISSSGVHDATQIHTHMCYSEFNDIIGDIAAMDADVITIECSRSQMELLDAFADFKYPNEIGPGVYDIHSPRVPARKEMEDLLRKAARVVPADRLWVNPDCGLKTRGWNETRKALEEMVAAAKAMRVGVAETV